MANPCLSWCFTVVCCIFVFPVCYIAAKKFIDMPGNVRDGTEVSPSELPEHYEKKEWTPSCAPDGFMDSFSAFAKKQSFVKVSYKSRAGKSGQEVVQLAGWWLPPPTETAPRIVVQHGFMGNGNNLRTQAMAYSLRSMGFGVLINNFRDHGLSNSSDLGKVTWGWSYPHDLLGAWDYAVKDPQNKLGGPLDFKKVGIVGFSMGGFTTATAFGMEKNIPAVWLDSAAFSPKDGLHSGAVKTAGAFMGGLLLEPAWAIAKWYAGVDLALHTPEKTLPTGPETKRPIGIVHDHNDPDVIFENAEKMLGLLKDHPTKYSVQEKWFPTDACKGSWHCHLHIGLPNTYRTKLCKFWGEVLDFKGECGVTADFPMFEGKVKETKLYASTPLHRGLPGMRLAFYTFAISSCAIALALGVVVFRRRHRVNDEEKDSLMGSLEELDARTLSA